jgi:hypothetical protein
MKTQETADFSVRKKMDPDFQCERNCYLFIYLCFLGLLSDDVGISVMERYIILF